MIDDTLTWERLEEIRVALARRTPCSIADFDGFCVSVTSPDDVGLLREIVLKSPIRTAAFAAFNLVWFVGIGDLADLVRVRLRGIPSEYMNDMDETIPALISKCAKDLLDTNAVRFLYEFQHRPSFAHEITKLGRIDSLPIPDCFFWNRREQISRFIAQIGNRRLTDDESLRCRNFLDDDRITAMLVDEISHGGVIALSSLLLKEGTVSWGLFASVKPNDLRQRNILRNLTLENLKRGAIFEEAGFYAKADSVFATIVEEIAQSGMILDAPLYF